MVCRRRARNLLFLGKTVKAYCRYRGESRPIQRVVQALEKHAPNRVQIVDNENEARLVVLHVTGRNILVRRKVETLRKAGKLCIIIQYVLRGSRNPNTKDWVDIWERAEFVWSYYDLFAMCHEDGTRLPTHFYRSPLGVDASIFYPRAGFARPYIIGTHGSHFMMEGVRECFHAAQHLGKPQAHLGTGILPQPNVLVQNNLDDNDVAILWSQCQFVAGLRRKEGFELPAAEGLLCGARPLLFDQPYYRKWYGDFGVFLPSLERADLITYLESVFRQGATPVSTDEIAAARDLFNWRSIASSFWEYLHEG